MAPDESQVRSGREIQLGDRWSGGLDAVAVD
jgi:hypothetical protein